MYKIKSLVGIYGIILSGLLFFTCIEAVAAEGYAQAYKKDPELTPILENVVLQDLNTSGYLCNSYLTLLLKKDSHYDYPAYSNSGNFIYTPVLWDYYNISAEGIKFDAASAYYYLTLARRYFYDHFGFKQSWDGEAIEQVLAYLFFEDQIDGVYPESPRVISLQVIPKPCV